MPVRPKPLKVGDNVEIEFIALSSNSGTSVVNSGYFDDPPHVPAPVVPPTLLVARGASGIQNTTVAKAFSLVIDMDVPPGGGGELRVRVGGALHDSGAITHDQDWIYVIV
jgi:hypothetical protein